MHHTPPTSAAAGGLIIVASIVGNEADPAWKSRLGKAKVDLLRLDQWQAQKNRFRKVTEGGVEVAVSLDRTHHLHDGDILVWHEDLQRAIVARIELSDVLVVHLGGLLHDDKDIVARTCFELGHALGNQHWPAVVKGTDVYVPLTVDRKVMDSVMRTHAFAGISHEFKRGTEVIPYLLPHEARRLFGGADATPHSHLHTHADGTVHSHAHDHHSHTHGHDHPHSHG